MVDHGDSDMEEESILHKAIDSAIAPVRVLTSRTAIKAYLSTLLFVLASTALLTISTTAYLFFYYNYIPPINLSKPIYLQYGLGACPAAVASLDNCPLISQQPYDVDIQLTMPRTPINLAAGNFMVDLQLLGHHNPLLPKPESFGAFLRNVTAPQGSGLSVLHHSRRPAMLTYTSPIPFLAQTMLYLPLHLFNIKNLDTACLRIPMFELLSFSRGSANIPTHVRLEIQSDSSANTGSTMPTFNIPFLGSTGGGSGMNSEVRPRALQVYSSKISFCARFGGLRYVVHNYRVLSFAVFTTLFYLSAVLSMGLAWAAISTLWNREKGEGWVVKQENGAATGGKGKGKAEDEPDDSQSQARIKLEEEEESTSGGLSPSNLSDTPATFPTASRQPPLQYPGRQSTERAVAMANQRLRMGEVADDEEGGQGQMESVWERQAREKEAARGGDSGLGTSLESDGPGVVRRRSGRNSWSGSRDRGQCQPFFRP